MPVASGSRPQKIEPGIRIGIMAWEGEWEWGTGGEQRQHVAGQRA